MSTCSWTKKNANRLTYKFKIKKTTFKNTKIKYFDVSTIPKDRKTYKFNSNELTGYGYLRTVQS